MSGCARRPVPWYGSSQSWTSASERVWKHAAAKPGFRSRTGWREMTPTTLAANWGLALRILCNSPFPHQGVPHAFDLVLDLKGIIARYTGVTGYPSPSPAGRKRAGTLSKPTGDDADALGKAGGIESPFIGRRSAWCGEHDLNEPCGRVWIRFRLTGRATKRLRKSRCESTRVSFNGGGYVRVERGIIGKSF